MTDDEVPAFPQLRPSRAERAASAVLPVSGVVWTAAEVMHMAGLPALDPALASLGAAGHAYGGCARRGWSWRTAGWIAAAGAWVSLAAAQGPLAGWPYPALTGIWGIGSLIAWRMARGHPAVVQARDWRDARAGWLATCREWNLGGSHLLAHEYTRLGEAFDVDVAGTGRLASAIARSRTSPRAHRRVPWPSPIPRQRHGGAPRRTHPDLYPGP